MQPHPSPAANAHHLRRVVITGGAGFIGSHVVERLSASAGSITVLDDLSSGRRENLHPGAELFVADAGNPDALTAVLAGADAVVHLAAEVSVARSVADPGGCVQRNIVATQTLASAAAAAGVRRIVFASSAAVYGDDPPLPTPEHTPFSARSPYAASKAAGELLLQAATAGSGLSAVCLRFFNVYGPRQDGSSPYSGVISAFLTARAAQRRPTVFGDGLQSRDFVYVGDVARAVELALTAPMAQACTAMNIGTGRSSTLLELAASIEGLMPPEHRPPRPGDVRHSLPDIRLAERLLGFKAQTTLADGLRETARWYDGRPDNVRSSAAG